MFEFLNSNNIRIGYRHTDSDTFESWHRLMMSCAICEVFFPYQSTTTTTTKKPNHTKSELCKHKKLYKFYLVGDQICRVNYHQHWNQIEELPLKVQPWQIFEEFIMLNKVSIKCVQRYDAEYKCVCCYDHYLFPVWIKQNERKKNHYPLCVAHDAMRCDAILNLKWITIIQMFHDNSQETMLSSNIFYCINWLFHRMTVVEPFQWIFI